MNRARVVLDRDFVVGQVPGRLFGSFVEHLGRAVYGGIYEPGHPAADERGFRRDVLALVRELGVSVVRYPGGNFVSGYRWEDGVGPRNRRPRRRELAWMSTETNQFGTDEFVDWCRVAGVEPMMAVNLGLRGPAEAGELFEYCNHPAGTALADQRIANGHLEPHDVRLWCLGNEMDGPWQMGNLPAGEYGRKAREAAKLMGWPDKNRSSTPLPECEFVVCGSSARGMGSYGQWDQAVLEECFEQVDYLSVHSYISPMNRSVESLLAFPETMGTMIREITAICDAVAARRKSRKRVNLSYDEWNVWYMERPQPPFEAWAEAPPLLEDVYTLADALCVGGMLITLLNHCDRVRIACLAQLVNVIGPIMTRTGGPAWRQTIFHPFAQASRLGRGEALRHVTESPAYSCDGEDVPTLATAAVRTGDGGVNLFLLNRGLASPLRVSVELRAFGAMRPARWSIVQDADLSARNTEQQPARIQPRPHGGATIEGGVLTCELPPASWNVIELEPVA